MADDTSSLQGSIIVRFRYIGTRIGYWVGYLRQSLRANITMERICLLCMVFTLLFALGVGVLWIFVSVIWPEENLLHKSTGSISLDGEHVLQIDYPATIPADGSPAEIDLSLYQRHPLTQTLAVSLTLPTDLILVSPVDQSHALTATVLFSPTASPVQTATLKLMNARSVNMPLMLDRTIAVLTAKREIARLQVNVESVRRAVLRDFFSHEISERSPLFIFAVALVSAVGLFYTNYQKQQEARRIEERERTAREEQQNRKIAYQRLKDFREAICASDGTGNASNILKELEQPLLALYLGRDLERARDLLAIIEGRVSEIRIDALAIEWPEETACALIAAFDHKVTRGVFRALRLVPQEKLSNRLRDRFHEIYQMQNLKGAMQDRNWPLRPELPSQERLSLEGALGGRLKNINPFPHDRAEDEADLLFARRGSAIWPEHPLYKRLKSNRGVFVVWGGRGMGKTAMALALGEYPDTDEPLAGETLSCYLAGLPDLPTIQIAFAQKLLDFAQYHPTLLGNIGQHERHLLGRVCVEYLGREVALAQIDAVPPEELEWLKWAPSKEQQTLWQSDALIQLRLLRQTILDLPSEQAPLDLRWPLVFVCCARSLGFKRCRLVIDATGGGWAEWMQRFTMLNLHYWASVGLPIVIFVPANPARTLALSGPNALADSFNCSELHWQIVGNADLLAQMLQWRYEQVASHFEIKMSFAELIPSELLNKMIASVESNPRRFIRLWNQITLLDPSSGKITEQILQQLENQVEYP